MEAGKDGNMSLRWIGALITVFGCGGFGFFLAFQHRQEETNLRQLIAVLDYMECELEYRLTSLPDLCRNAAGISTGRIRNLFQILSRELDRQIAPDAYCCMQAALNGEVKLSDKMGKILSHLGKNMGRFDLPGQIRGISHVRQECVQLLSEMTANRDARLRSYQTLGLCAGAALAILFL